MNEKYYKTPLEQDILEQFEGAKVITSAQVRDLFPERRKEVVHNTLSSLAGKGFVHRLKRDLYLVTPDGHLDPSDLLRAAPMMYQGYIAFSTALKMHGLLDYEPFTIFTATVDRSRTVSMGEYQLRFVSLGSRCAHQTNLGGIWVSDLEKTVLDCIYKPSFAGGWGNIAKAIYSTKGLDHAVLGRYLEIYGSAPMLQRAGYVLDAIAKGTGIKIPESVLRICSRGVRTPARLYPSRPGKGTYSRRWKMIDNSDKGELLGWF